MKAFESLKIEIVYFEQEDVVRTSIDWLDNDQPGDGHVDFDDLFGENA